MKELGRYCTETHMFPEAPHTLNVGKLIMWRHIAENSVRMGRHPEGPPAGEIALALVVQTNTPVEKIMDRKMRQHMAANGDY